MPHPKRAPRGEVLAMHRFAAWGVLPRRWQGPHTGVWPWRNGKRASRHGTAAVPRASRGRVRVKGLPRSPPPSGGDVAAHRANNTPCDHEAPRGGGARHPWMKTYPKRVTRAPTGRRTWEGGGWHHKQAP